MARNNVNQIAQVLREHVYKDYEALEGIDSWRKLPEIPSPEEIVYGFGRKEKINDSDDGDLKDRKKNRPELPVNIIDGPWPSIESYVGSHYKLLREDAVAPLRKAVALFKAQPTMQDNEDVSIYTNVYIVGMTSAFIGLSSRIEFSYERAGKKIRWQQSKRLQQGTIVALTPVQDKFKSICKVAVVAARPLSGVEQNPPQIDLIWATAEDTVFDPTVEYVMIEARSGYFEASRHMLVALQKLVTERFPLSEHLVNLNRSVSAPEFVKKQPMRDLNSLVMKKVQVDSPNECDKTEEEGDASLENVDILGQWPEIYNTILDESQMDALRRIITKQLAMVQGPPGTGKTFTSISALKVMVDSLGPNDPPIVVAAQTNHALDQLLTLIAPVVPKFLRLGGRSKEENAVIKERTVYELLSKARESGMANVSFRGARRVLQTRGTEIEVIITKAMEQGNEEAERLLDLKIISKEHYDSLFDENWVSAQDPQLPPGVLALWLGVEQVMDCPSCPPTNMGFEEEENPEFETLEEEEMEFFRKDDDELDALSGHYYSVRERFTGRPSPGWSDKRIQKELGSKANLWDIPHNIRGQVYRYFRRLIKERTMVALQNSLKMYNRSVKDLKVVKWQQLAAVVKKDCIKLIGCTTTGLSKYRGFIASLQPRTLFIEEAAETLEGTILAAMFDSIQQLVLVGDHQQLQATCNSSTLSKQPYNLAVSMFERLVNNGLEYTMLNRQRRMIPEIRQILNPFYPDLQDHHSVLDRTVNRMPVPGMGGRDSYFFHHQWPESRDDSLSRYNFAEAAMVSCFFNYLVLNRVDPSKITVLTFYNGQRKEIIGKLRKLPDLASHGRNFNVFTVDSYQGEENDVILLSLVRSNSYHNIGFLENKNRAVVSLSRARRGLYIFGNAISLLSANAQSFELWKTITGTFKSRGRFSLSGGMPIVCSNHHTETLIRDLLDWEYITGGCLAKCNGQLPCGHSCPLKCHPFLHEDMICKEPCRFVLPCGHQCPERCGNKCRCLCEISAIPPNMTGDLRDGAWQPSLDDVLGDSLPSSAQSRGRTDSRPSTPAENPLFNSAGSSPTKWKEWNAKKADKALEEFHAAKKSATASTAKLTAPVFKDVFRAVITEDGSRTRQAGGKTVQMITPKLEPLVVLTDVGNGEANAKVEGGIEMFNDREVQRGSLDGEPIKLDLPDPFFVESTDNHKSMKQASAKNSIMGTSCCTLLDSASSITARDIPISNTLLITTLNTEFFEEDLISFD